MFAYAIERFAPFAIGAATLLLCIFLKSAIVDLFKSENLTVIGLYSAVFGWSAIQTGFLFGVFGFVAGSQSGFIQKVRDTTPLRKFIVYTRNATIIGFLLTFASMPFMLINKEVADFGPTMYLAVSAWFALFVWAFFAFARVAYLFGLLLKPKGSDPIPG